MTAPAAAPLVVDVGGRRVAISHPDRPLWTDPPFAKRDLAAWWRAVAPAILPHVAGRPLTLARFPEGVAAGGFYQENCPPGRPGWIPVAAIRFRTGRVLRFCVASEEAALVWLANLAAVELHPMHAEAARPDAARALVVDLDPGPGAGLDACARVALAARARLEAAGLHAAVKTSGGKGLHVAAGLDGTRPFPAVLAFARGLAKALAAERPAEVTDALPLAARAGRVLVDWRQNDGTRSTVAPYSLRAATRPRVSAPLRWEEVEALAASADAVRVPASPGEVLARLDRDGDLYAAALLPQRLADLSG